MLTEKFIYTFLRLLNILFVFIYRVEVYFLKRTKKIPINFFGIFPMTYTLSPLEYYVINYSTGTGTILLSPLYMFRLEK